MGESLDLYFYLIHENIFLIVFIEIIFAIFIFKIYLHLNVVLIVFVNLYLNEFDFSPVSYTHLTLPTIRA